MTSSDSKSSPGAAKAALRRASLRAIRNAPAEARDAASRRIRRAIEEILAGELKSGAVLIFAALPSEPDLVPLVERQEQLGVRICFPRVAAPGKMTFHHVTEAALLAPVAGAVREPDAALCPEVDARDIALAFVPGLAFDPNSGTRLGRGGGFYDRLLARDDFSARAVGVCFACQLLARLPAEPHDQKVSRIVTEIGAVEI